MGEVVKKKRAYSGTSSFRIAVTVVSGSSGTNSL
jgi:hypothetical protein